MDQPSSPQPNQAPHELVPVAEMCAQSPRLVERYPEIADDENERLVYDVHKHWIGQVGIIATAVITILALIGVAAGLPLMARSSNIAVAPGIGGIAMLVMVIILVCVLAGSAIALWVYKASRILVTGQNVIELRQSSLFSRQVSHLNMINVEDVTVIKHGILQTLLNYGTLQIQTAGETDNFNFLNTPTPDVYRRFIIRAHEIAIEEVGERGPVQRTEIAHNNL